MILAEVKHPSSLSDQEAGAWRGFCAAEPAWGSPLLGPDFAQLVGKVRDDARVACFSRGGRQIGFLAFHRRPNGLARPIGATYSDYHALITAPGEAIDGPRALAAAQLSGLRLTGLIDPGGVFGDTRECEHEGHVLTLQGSADEHHLGLKAANPKRYKNWGRLRNKLEREVGELTLTPGDDSQEAFDLLVAWKQEQYRSTGTHDVLRPDWVQRMFRTAFEQRTGELRGVMITLRAGGRLVAGHFGVAQNGILHSWLSSIDRDLTACAPGQVLMFMAPEALQELSLSTLDLGPAHAHYKAPFATGNVAIQEGLAAADGRAGRTVRSVESAWALAGHGRIEAVARLRRRLEQITGAETSVGGHVRGVVDALAGYHKRAAAREPRPVLAAEDA